MFQSLGRDSGHSDWTPAAVPRPANSRFQSLGRDSGHSDVGWPRVASLTWMFQSLGRDSGHSNTDRWSRRTSRRSVSIARARFGPFRQMMGRMSQGQLAVSIARARFGPLRRLLHFAGSRQVEVFQSLGQRFGPLRRAWQMSLRPWTRRFNRSGAIRATPTARHGQNGFPTWGGILPGMEMELGGNVVPSAPVSPPLPRFTSHSARLGNRFPTILRPARGPRGAGFSAFPHGYRWGRWSYI